MSRNQNKKIGLNKRLAFDAALGIGILGFTLSLWKVPGFIQFISALGIGVAAGLLTYLSILFATKHLSKYLAIDSSSHSASQSDESLYTDNESKLDNGMTLSIHSPSNYDSSPDKRAKRPRLQTNLPKRWSGYLVDTVEWRVFDRICIAFWRLKGNKISGIAERTQDGIDFFISAPSNKQFRIGVVQTRSTQARAPAVEDMKNLITLRDKNNLSIAILMYAGKLSNVVYSYCVTNGIRLLDSEKISKGLKDLPENDQQQLLKALIRPDYLIPSCPSCLIKLIKRKSVKSGKVFWGCVSYPECNFTINRGK